MTIKTTKLIHQIRQAQQLGQLVLDISGLTDLDLVYAFATETTLVINCRDYESVWRLEDGQFQLRQAINILGLLVQTIHIEKNGQLLYEF